MTTGPAGPTAWRGCGHHAKPDGLVTATVSRSPDGVAIRIVDDGEGIPPEQHGRIFERFARLDGRSNGAGLGPPIARWIAEAHGGTLVLESSGPGGSCFAIGLPSDPPPG